MVQSHSCCHYTIPEEARDAGVVVGLIVTTIALKPTARTKKRQAAVRWHGGGAGLEGMRFSVPMRYKRLVDDRRDRSLKSGSNSSLRAVARGAGEEFEVCDALVRRWSC